MKHLIVAFTLIGTFAVSAAEQYISPVTGKPFVDDGRITLEKLKARDERVMKKTGGFLVQKAEGPLLMVVDSREKPTKTIDEIHRLYKLGTHLDSNAVRTPRGETDALEFAQGLMAKEKPLMVVVVVEKCPKLPALSVFPEERVGLVNADKLKGGDDPSAPEVRVAKELWRAIGFIGGIGFSAQENDMMQPYYTLKELDDNYHAYIQPMNMAKMYGMLKRFGVKKEARIPYRVAVAQGWAPAPTNDLQKAVWEEVHAAPKNPMKIQYDPKKGR